jgi:hypothetical protein
MIDHSHDNCLVIICYLFFHSITGGKHPREGREAIGAVSGPRRCAFIACRTGEGETKGSNINIVVYD